LSNAKTLGRFLKLYIDFNQLNGTVPSLVNTAIVASGTNLKMCGGDNIIKPSGNTVVDTFAQDKDDTYWNDTSGCPSINDIPTITQWAKLLLILLLAIYATNNVHLKAKN